MVRIMRHAYGDAPTSWVDWVEKSDTEGDEEGCAEYEPSGSEESGDEEEDEDSAAETEKGGREESEGTESAEDEEEEGEMEVD